MAKQSTVIAAVRLARDPRRLLVLPGLAIVAGIGGAAASRLVEGLLGMALGVAGLLVAVVGIYLAAWLFSCSRPEAPKPSETERMDTLVCFVFCRYS